MFRARFARFARLATRLAAVSLTLLSASTTAYGQASGTATIRGTVEDSSGGILPGATVTLTNVATKATQSAVTTTAAATLQRRVSRHLRHEGRARPGSRPTSRRPLPSARRTRGASTSGSMSASRRRP